MVIPVSDPDIPSLNCRGALCLPGIHPGFRLLQELVCERETSGKTDRIPCKADSSNKGSAVFRVAKRGGKNRGAASGKRVRASERRRSRVSRSSPGGCCQTPTWEPQLKLMNADKREGKRDKSVPALAGRMFAASLVGPAR